MFSHTTRRTTNLSQPYTIMSVIEIFIDTGD